MAANDNYIKKLSVLFQEYTAMIDQTLESVEKLMLRLYLLPTNTGSSYIDSFIKSKNYIFAAG